MIRAASKIAVFILALAPTAAISGISSTRLVLTIPAQCSIDVLGALIDGNRLVVEVHRNCNTGHDVVLFGQVNETLDDVTVHYNGDTGTFHDGEIILPQLERYYDQTDNLVIEASGANAQDMLHLAASVQMRVVVA